MRVREQFLSHPVHTNMATPANTYHLTLAPALPPRRLRLSAPPSTLPPPQPRHAQLHNAQTRHLHAPARTHSRTDHVQCGRARQTPRKLPKPHKSHFERESVDFSRNISLSSSDSAFIAISDSLFDVLTHTHGTLFPPSLAILTIVANSKVHRA